MIVYDNKAHIRLIFQMRGSAFPKALRPTIIVTLWGLFLACMRRFESTSVKEVMHPNGSVAFIDNVAVTVNLSYYEATFRSEKLIYHYMAMTILSVVVGYLIVVRTNMALARWMEGIGEVQTMISTWMDAVTTVFAFFADKRHVDPEILKRRLLARIRLGHYFSLLSCLAFAQLREGNQGGIEDFDISNLAVRPLYPKGGERISFTDSADADSKAKHGGTRDKKKYDKMTELTVLHAPMAEELRGLFTSSDKANTVCLWIIQLLSAEVRHGTITIPPPIISRVFDELSNSMHGFHQAHKVSMVPFPFPFAQMVDYILLIWWVLLPIFVDCVTKNIIFTPLISFLLTAAWSTLNCVAVELEEPFGFHENAVDIEDRHEGFIKVLDDLLKHQCQSPHSKETVELVNNVIDGYATELKDAGVTSSAIDNNRWRPRRNSASMSPLELQRDLRRLSQQLDETQLPKVA